jgi:hypothetical protein
MQTALARQMHPHNSNGGLHNRSLATIRQPASVIIEPVHHSFTSEA